MSTYPEVITPDHLKKYAKISDAEVARDIAETEHEIVELRKTLEAEEQLAKSHPSPMERKLAHFKASTRPYQIEQRQRFVDFLKRLQDARAAAIAEVTA